MIGSDAIDLLKLEHHGGARNAQRHFFKAVTADVFVASANGRGGNFDIHNKTVGCGGRATSAATFIPPAADLGSAGQLVGWGRTNLTSSGSTPSAALTTIASFSSGRAISITARACRTASPIVCAAAMAP